MYKKFMKNVSSFILMLLFSTKIFAQAQPVQMADTMRSNGKIYIVVAVCLTILIGLFLYLFILDRKILSIEKNN